MKESQVNIFLNINSKNQVIEQKENNNIDNDNQNCIIKHNKKKLLAFHVEDEINDLIKILQEIS